MSGLYLKRSLADLIPMCPSSPVRYADITSKYVWIEGSYSASSSG